MTFDIPQVREGLSALTGKRKCTCRDFNSQGIRSDERALLLTLKVAAITEKLCGAKISASQVSRSSQLLDEELKVWSDRSWGEIVYLYLDAYYEKVMTDRLLDQFVQQEMKKF